MQPKAIRIDGVIGTGENEISAQMVREQLPENGTDPIAVKIHSEGGSVFEGFAMHDVLAAYKGPKTLSIESCAFSIASFVAMAFDDVEISSNGYMMLHNPYMEAEGDDEAFAKTSQRLAQLKTTMISAYATRSGKPEAELTAILKAETYLNAQQAVEMGFAKRITGQPVIGRPLARMSNMPHGVVSALLGAGSGGENRETTEGKPMSTSQPVAATLPEIEAAFPKASAEFVVKCLKQGLPMASVATAAVDEVMAENATLRAEVQSLKDAAAKAAMPEPEQDDEEKPQETPAARSGVKPLAKAKTGGTATARVRWDAAVADSLPKCRGDKMKAVAMASRTNPGLREEMLREVNV